IKAYKEYYACATREAAPKPKASARKKIGGSSSSTTLPTPIATPTPTTIVVAAPRLSAAAKGKQPARATTPTEPTDVERTKAKQLKIVLKMSRLETHISQQRGSGTDEGTGSRPGVLDVPSDDLEEELSWNSSDDEDVDEQTKSREESEGDKTDEGNDEDETSKISKQEATKSDKGHDEATDSDRENNEDDDNNKEDQGLRIGEEEMMQEEEDTEELYRDVKTQVKAQVTRILPRIKEAVNTQLEAEVLTRSSHSSRTLYAVAADLSEMELKKILIDKIEGNKSTQRSDEQQNLYKALVEAYDADKTILDTYGESTILKRRREDDDQEGPFAGSDRGSKRQREGGENASASTLSEPATISTG
nr:hypothetical protein [Tanacetum cinerariifolium]